jgi:hypothetical protein
MTMRPTDLLLEMIRQGISGGKLTLGPTFMLELFKDLSDMKFEMTELRTGAALVRLQVEIEKLRGEIRRHHVEP